ncbi:TetR/AcrR family transcriptional regulator [Acetobacter oeni]|uniref:HTH tetR-type domain-containing protein n=1 Tax=Acetobacter oeni TaxID=304077 RepID=A0A511XL93_9PROT|nr:TetR/AcrR family transcriptional regulator [Acetobacter oeni]MBB3883906.1 hypothetical protein [Acetobacter oeni]GBR02615.1 hypothetical protein AA21952_0810 [Acetobacter oeni LMG 21952]GEN63712.1 hypothetical protein AOE01nite_19360 [Acetobacter oeni]
MKRKDSGDAETEDTEANLLKASDGKNAETASHGEDLNAKRQQILTGAGAIFAELRYEGASMSHIARRSSVSKGTLYNYFDSKAALFAAFVKQKACQELPHTFSSIRKDLPPGKLCLVCRPGYHYFHDLT